MLKAVEAIASLEPQTITTSPTATIINPTISDSDIAQWAQKCPIPLGAISKSHSGSVSMAEEDSWDDLEIPDDGLGHDVSMDHEGAMSLDDLDDIMDKADEHDGSSQFPRTHTSQNSSSGDVDNRGPRSIWEDLDLGHTPGLAPSEPGVDHFSLDETRSDAMVEDSTEEEDWDAEYETHSAPKSVIPSAQTQRWKEVAEFLRNNQNAPTSSPKPTAAMGGLVQNLSSKPSTPTAAPIETMDDDFDIPNEQTTLKLSDLSSRRAEDSRAPGGLDSDLASDWGDGIADEDRGGLANRRFLASPTPSSNASVIASESEDEKFDDIEFPAAMETLRFQTRQLFDSAPNPVFEEDEKEDPLEGLEISEAAISGVVGDIPSTSTSTQPTFQLKIPVSASSSPSRIPRRVTSQPTPSLSTNTSFTSLLEPQSPLQQRSSTRTASTSNLTPSITHLSKLSAQLIQSRSTGKDSSEKPPTLVRKPKSKRDFGDGTELDGFDDLPVNSSAESNVAPKRVATAQGSSSKALSTAKSGVASKGGNIKSSGVSYEDLSRKRPVRAFGMEARKGGEEGENRRPQASGPNLIRATVNNVNNLEKRAAGHKKRPKKKPTLIRNLNARDICKVVGSMTYNPDLQKWEGNEEALLDFDRATPVRPALITNKGGSKMPHTVGQMVFDPVKMCWIGNEEDVDVFAGVLSEEEMEKMSDMTDFNSHSDFELSKAEKEAIHISESAHKLFVGRWYPKAVTDSRSVMRDTSKAHLYEIRSLTQKRKHY
ncbi:hypothetical protein HK097_007399 [Rhizophlyctis rosea]|uniref:Protein byr4 n=1 Tax=Rhizophlyctis rosea TaxID=64517 RepID=A0AAD5SJV9_9FUNG|nr:hypothetical protein HK097_007399 [Rhizophlyctis rosea]